MSARWSEFRAQMPIAPRWAYFDHAAVAPLSAPAAVALQAWLREATEQGDTVWPQWARRVEEVRSTAAELIQADTGEIALVRNTTEGVNLVAEGLAWKSGDNMVTLDDEFPSNQYPWLNQQHRGVEVRRLPTDRGRISPEALDAACDARTRVVAISWVGYATGFRHDVNQLAEIAHRHGALLFLDAIQGLGVFPLDVSTTPVDFLAADGHKWLLGPEGAGVLYIRRKNLDLLRPLGVGWNSVAHSHDFGTIECNWKPSAERYEGGTQNMAGFLALAASLKLLMSLGTEQLAGRILEITDLACGRLSDIGAQIVSHRDGPHRSGIVAFEIPGHDPSRIRSKLLDAGVVVSCRGGRLRIAPHGYNDSDDVERLVTAIEEAKEA
jgi:selenocysteine lyase/cysteine desulfurase